MMGRRRDHYPRFTSACPDPAACDRLYHGDLAYGDHCECCGDFVGEPEPEPRYRAEEWRDGTWIVRDTVKGGHLGLAYDPHGKPVMVPGGINETEARRYADRINGPS